MMPVDSLLILFLYVFMISDLLGSVMILMPSKFFAIKPPNTIALWS